MKSFSLMLLVITVLLQIGFINTSQCQSLEWVKMFGGDYIDQSNAIELDEYGNVYITGLFSTTVDFDPGSGVFELTKQGGYHDSFLSKLTPEGDFVWAKGFQGSEDVHAFELEIDFEGNIYVVGDFFGLIDFDPGIDTFNLFHDEPHAGFVVKLNSDGEFLWAKKLDFGSIFNVISIDTDGNGNVYLAGSLADSADLDVGIDNQIVTNVGDVFDLYFCKWDSDGNFIWGKHFYCANDEFRPVVQTMSGYVYLSGNFSDTLKISSAGGQIEFVPIGDYDMFLTKFTSDGSVVWARQFGGSGQTSVVTCMPDSAGNIYLGGFFSGTVDFDPSTGVTNLSATNSWDAFVTKIDENGNLVWCRGFDGDDNMKTVHSLALGRNGNLLVSGAFNDSLDADPGSGVQLLIADTSNRTFLLSLSESGDFRWATNTGGWSPPVLNGGNRLAVDDSNYIYITDYFLGTIDFDPGPDVYPLTSPWYEIYVQKISPPIRLSGISDVEEEFGFYPNPTTGLLWSEHLQGANHVSIYDCFGELVFQTEGFTNPLDISSLSDGLYVISFTKDKGSFSQKIVLTR